MPKPTTIRDVPHTCVLDKPLRKIGGLLHVEVALDDLRPGDYVFFDGEHGRRVRRVCRVVRGRRGTTVHVAPLVSKATRTVLDRARRVDLRAVQSAWRRRTKGRSDAQ